MSLLSRKPHSGAAGRSPGRTAAPDAGRPRRLARLARRLAWGGAILAIAVVVVVKGREFLYDSSYFQIRNVVIDGAGAEATARIQARLDSEEGPRNLVEASPGAVRALLLEIPELRDVAVRRHLPDTLVIDAVERYPVAVLVGERNYLFDSDLVAMGTLEGKDFLDSRLPLLTVDAPPAVTLGERIEDARVARGWEIVSELRRKSPDMAVNVAETHIGEDGEVTLHLNGGTEVRLGLRPPERVLPVLEAFYRETNGMHNLEYAELEYRNQVAFKRRGESAPRTTAPGDAARDGDSLPSH